MDRNKKEIIKDHEKQLESKKLNISITKGSSKTVADKSLSLCQPNNQEQILIEPVHSEQVNISRWLSSTRHEKRNTSLFPIGIFPN